MLRPRLNFWWVGGVLLIAGALVLGSWWVDRPTPSVTTERVRPAALDTARVVALPVSAVTVPDTQAQMAQSATPADIAASDSGATPGRTPLAENLIRIQLLNGTKVKGLARTVSQGLRLKGFDVREVGNAGHFGYTKCQLIDRSGTELLARIVADSIGVTAENISAAVESRLVDIDVTLVLGSDYKTLRIIP